MVILDDDTWTALNSNRITRCFKSVFCIVTNKDLTAKYECQPIELSLGVIDIANILVATTTIATSNNILIGF